ncbi:tRNA epoxyqueuosine(34) reductase QueG [Cyclonatronum proteinivorum]|nr:tRNA epoxyqueuosine(34) reductase QueG [Cyclonatronum proteinivorum]
MNKQQLTAAVRAEANRLGFEGCGFAKAGFLEDEARRLEKWLLAGKHGKMHWMENHFDKRVDPTKLVPGAKSVISVLCSYHQPELFREHASDEANLRISKYALGEDYHFVLKDKLYQLFEFTKKLNGGLEGRVFVDSAPVMDKAWAVKSGLGWMGKHTNVISRKAGSCFFLGEMIVDAVFDYDSPTTDHCGSCTRCIDACPTDAITEPYSVDGSKCISYFTIELRDEIPAEYHDKLGNWIFGCDICQDVCPWNRKALPGSEPRLMARDELLGKDKGYWEELNLQEFRRLFKKNPVKRTKFDGLKRNIAAVRGNKKGKD